MNAPFDPVTFIHRLEAEGIARGAAEAIAQGIEDRNRELATTGDVDRAVGSLASEIERLATSVDRVANGQEKFAVKADLADLITKIQLDAALAKVTVQFGAMLAAAVGLATAILGTIIALR